MTAGQQNMTPEDNQRKNEHEALEDFLKNNLPGSYVSLIVENYNLRQENIALCKEVVTLKMQREPFTPILTPNELSPLPKCKHGMFLSLCSLCNPQFIPHK